MWTFKLAVLLSFAIALPEDPVVAVEAAHVKVDRKGKAMIRIMVSVKKGYHIQSADATNDLIPTSVRFTGPEGVRVFPARFPRAAKFRLEGTDDFLDVYDGEFLVRVPVQMDEPKIGRYTIEGEFHYQACDARQCFFPRTIPFTVELFAD